MLNPMAFQGSGSMEGGHVDMGFLKSIPLDTQPEAVSIESSQMETGNTADLYSMPVKLKPWMKRSGGPIGKIDPDVKRRRKNFKAKKLLTPKHPLMVLNEMKTGLVYTFQESTSENNQIIFHATVDVDGKSFTGEGMSKKQAQQEAAEAALKGLFFEKLMEQLMRNKDDDNVEMKDSDDSTYLQEDASVKQAVPEDDVPWGGLASLAMYKLVDLWQQPSLTKTCNANQIKAPSANVKAKLPANASEIDPVMLLYQISPLSKFIEQSRDVRNNVTVFTLSVDFNGQSYVGSATKKKQAKKLCAKSALESLGVQYNA